MNIGKKGTHWIGFDLGGTKMMAVVFDHRGNVLGKNRRKTKGYEGQEVGLQRMAKTITEALKEAQLQASDISGIGVGLPGILEIDRGILLDGTNLGWKNVPIRDTLTSQFGIPVAIINDVDAGTYGEYSLGAGQDARCVLGVFPGTGVGAGCIYEGKLIRGKRVSCMEIGNIKIAAGSLLSGLQNPATLESLCGRLAIAASCAKEAYRGRAPHLLAQVGTDLGNIRSKALLEAWQAGDEAVVEILHHAIGFLGMGIANVVDLIGPDVIVIGGGLAEAMPELFQSELSKAIAQHCTPSLAEDWRVAIAQLGDYAGAIGAAAYAAAQSPSP